MMWRLSWMLTIGLGSFYAHAQQLDTTFFRQRLSVPAHLKPIERSVGPVYYYGGKRLRSPFSLEIPFYELNDPVVNHYYRAFRFFNTTSQVVALVPLAYLILVNKSIGLRPRDYWYVSGGSILATVGLGLLGNIKVRQAITRYNKSLAEARLGVSVQPLPDTIPSGQILSVVGIGLVLQTGCW